MPASCRSLLGPRSSSLGLPSRFLEFNLDDPTDHAALSAQAATFPASLAGALQDPYPRGDGRGNPGYTVVSTSPSGIEPGPVTSLWTGTKTLITEGPRLAQSA